MVKKLLFFFLVSFLFFHTANAQEQASAGMKQMQPYVENFTSFSKPYMASDLDAWKKLNSKDDEKHPEFGMLPKDAPCQDCIEIYKKRTRDERYFIDRKDHTKYYKQTALGDLSYEKKGQWLTIEHKLKQKSATVYESGYEHEPAGFEVDQKQGYIKTIKGKVAFNSWTLWSRTAGRQTKLANADWSNYTIGDDGVYIKNVFQGIDAQMIVFRGAIKTNFIMKRNSFGRFDELIFKDSFSGVPGINVSFSDNASLSEGNGEISIRATVGELLKMNNAVAYAQGADKDKMIAPSYLLEGQTVGMVIPYKWINENIGNYELIIDPLVSASSTLAQAAITGSAYSSTCISNSCIYNLSVSQPANTTITDIRWTFNYTAQGSCWLSDGSTVFRMNTCKSPFNDATTYWSCHGGIGTGTCNGNNISIFSDFRTCLPPPSCSIQNLSFQMQLSRCESNSSGCSNSCIGAGSPWTMTIEGRTTEFSNPTNPITLSNTTVCQGGSLTATSSTGIYGRSPYTYSWSFNASGTPVIATGATATINFPTAGNVTLHGFITDSCGNRIAASRAITVMPSASPSVSITATPSGTICPGTSVTFTANHTNGGSLPVFQWRKNGNPVGTNNVSYTDATLSNGDIITVTITSSNTCASPSSATSANYVVQSNPLNAVAQNITIQLDASGNATVTPAQINNGSSSGCGISAMSISVANFNCSNLGPNTVTLSVTDNAGNTDSATATVTVEDNIAPVAIAQNITVQLDAFGNATITAAQIDNGSSDNCAIASITLDKTTFNCSDTGANIVTLTVTDTAGNTDTATATVTLQNNILPTAVTQNITVQLNASGNASITPAQIDNGSTGNCSLMLSLDITSFNCSNIGANTVTLTVTDTSGNSNSATAIVTVEDNIAPNAIAQNITVQLNALGNATITPAQIDNGSSDNCSLVLSLDNTAFSCANIGANTVVLTATDPSGNTDNATANVTVEDNIAPIAIAQNITVQLDASGNATITPAQIDNGSSDNCAIASMTIDQSAFSCTDTGTHPVVLTVTDTSGNTSSATATVTIQNTATPTAVTQNISIQLDASGNATIMPSDVDGGSSGNCSLTLALDITSFDCSDIGANTVTLTITDASGNTDTATAIVTVEDNIAPLAIVQNITVQLDASGNATITTAQIDNGSNDNCSVVLSLNNTSFSCGDIGTNTVVLTATDPSGNTDTATATVTVEDNIAPIAIAQNIIVQLDASGNATITTAQIDNESNDNCSIASMTLDVSTFSCADIGTNTVTLTVTDTSGNTDTENAIVTVEDNIAPFAIAQNITVQLDVSGNATITPAQIDNGSNDNCVIASTTLDISNFTCANLGANTVTLTVTDASGNIDTATAIVTVEDTIAPIAIAQNITVQLDASGNATITTAQIDNGSNDNCSVVLSLNNTSFSCGDIGANTVVMTATDPSGNTDTAAATVTIEDNIAPNAIAQNITVQLDASGNATITPAQIDNGSNDNCAIASIILDVSNFTCANTGANTVTLTVTDTSGNTSSATATVTIEDNIAPNAIAQNITVQLDASGNAIITPAQIDNGSNDNCSIVSMTLDISNFSCADIGTNTVILTVADASGNTDTAIATLTVEDNLIPTAIAQNITVQLDASGNATITTAQIDNGSNDNCAIASMALDVSNFTCADIGTKIVTLNVTDTSGNTDSATAIVTIEDNIAPNAMAQNSIVQLNASGNATITPAQIDNGSSDNCAIASKTIDISNFTCANLGANTVTLTVTDTSGNTSSTTATVIVEDNIAPTAITQNITVPLNASGSAIITPTQINNGSNDNCAIVSMALDISNFSCTDIGTNTVALTVTDASGNNDTATATVTVLDSLPPTIAVNPTTLYLDASGNATLTIAAIDNGTADNCGLRDILLSKTIFGCADIGNNTVIVTANDIHGNTSTVSVIVTIADNLPPTAIAQNIQVSLGTNGTAILTPDMINNNSTDNCGIDSMSLDIVSLSCSNIGLNTVTLTVRDKFGNQDSTTAIVTVLPIPEPVADSPSQTFCFIDSPRVRDIAMASTHIVWYADQTITNTLSSNAILVTGNYYAATRYGNCYSTRIPVSIIVEDPAVPTGNTLQYFCLEEIHTIAQLQSDQQTVIWYDVSSGGMPLDSSETLESQTYYAAFLENGCESSKRLAIEAVVRNCDVKIYNAVSANSDGRNDFLLIEGVESFPENKLEIFNRWGSPVYEISRYGQPGNLFKGISNTGLASKGAGVLPFGTYFYVFSFTNHDGQRITKNGFIHLNN